jgi:probable O-glycosylation ligase (exosortase A-associated)
MRDIVITLIIFGSLPLILKRPWIGIIMWAWISYMNPHRLTWGFAYNMPFAAMVALATFAGLVFSKELKASIPKSGVLAVWVMLVIWLTVTTLNAIYPENAWQLWDRAMKIQLFALLSLWIMQGRQRIDALVWIIVISLGFYGVKGGLFAIQTAGAYKVWGPEDSFIYDNNTMALALVICVPLMRYLHTQATNKWLRRLLLGSMLLTGAAILSSQSRGAFLGAAAMTALLVWKSKQRIWMGLGVIIVAPLMVMSMPDSWTQRMWTIRDYQEDGSAMGRINAWHFAANLAADRPLTGGGFGTFEPELFLKYAPNPTDFHGAHSIYFEMLGEQGYVGLGLFVLLGFLAFRSAAGVVKRIDRDKNEARQKELAWARELSAMLQVSIFGFAVGGAFLSLSYFDLPYHIVALVLLARAAVQKAFEQETKPATNTLPVPRNPLGGPGPDPRVPVP